MIAMLNLRLVEPGVLVDISRVSALDYMKQAGGKLEIGAVVTQSTLE